MKPYPTREYIAWITSIPVMLPFAFAAGDLRDGSCRLENLPHRVPMLELYTSEGCGSCPPADPWFSTLPRRGVTSDRAV